MQRVEHITSWHVGEHDSVQAAISYRHATNEADAEIAQVLDDLMDEVDPDDEDGVGMAGDLISAI